MISLTTVNKSIKFKNPICGDGFTLPSVYYQSTDIILENHIDRLHGSKKVLRK